MQKVREVNTQRRNRAPNHQFSGESYLATELQEHPDFSLSYIIAPPRMAHYMEYSTRIYQIYLKYIAPEDIHVYSIDSHILQRPCTRCRPSNHPGCHPDLLL